MEAGGTCERCGAAIGESRWCPECGKDTRPGEATLPTPEAIEAGRRETAWLAGNPEVARAEEEAAGRMRALTAEEAFRHRARTPPDDFDDYSDPRPLTELATVALAINAVAALLAMAAAIYARAVVHGDSASAIDRAAERVDLGDALTSLALLIGGPIFIAWTYRVYRNVGPLGASGLRYGNGWAIGGWFVPVLFWWRPKQVLNDVWRTSDRDLPAQTIQNEWLDPKEPPLVMAAWWLTWVGTGILDRVVGAMERWPTPNVDAVLALRIASGVVATVAAVLAIVVVRMLARRQRERAARLRELGGGMAAEPPSPEPERPDVPA